MNDREKTRFDAFIALKDFRFARWENRRVYEWRVSLSLWAVMAGGTAVLKNTAPPVIYILIGLLMLIVPAHAWIWVKSNWVSNQQDINHAFFYVESAQKLLLKSHARDPMVSQGPLSKWKGLTEEQSAPFAFLKEPPCLMQVAATAALAIVLIAVLYCGQAPSHNVSLNISN